MQIMPIVLTSLLMCYVFALPIESGEKMSYALTVLLSYVVFLTWVTDSLPPISNDVSVLRECPAPTTACYLVCNILTGEPKRDPP